MKPRRFRRKISSTHSWRRPAFLSGPVENLAKRSKSKRIAHRVLCFLKERSLTEVVLAIIFAFILRDALGPVVVIEKFEVDNAIRDRLLSPEELALETQQSIAKKSEESTLEYDRDLIVGIGDFPEIPGETSTEFRLSDQQSVDFKVPSVDLSFLTIQNLIREAFGYQPKRVHIVVTKADERDLFGDIEKKDNAFELHISEHILFDDPKLRKYSSEEIDVVDSSGTASEVSRKIALASAICILKNTDPLTYAISLRKEDERESIKRLENLPPSTIKELLLTMFPWTDERKRQAIFHGFLGEELNKQKLEPGRAEAEYKLSYKLRPHPAIANNLGLFLYRQKRYPEAELWLNKALQMLPQHSLARSVTSVTLSHVFGAQGKLNEAISTMETSIEAWPNDPQNPYPYSEIAELYRQKHNLPSAERYAKEALRLAPVDGYVYFLLAEILDEESKRKQAIEVLSIAKGDKLGNSPTSVWRPGSYVMDELGSLLEDENGDKKAIENAYQLAIEDGPHEALAYRCMALYLERVGELRRAQGVLNLGIKNAYDDSASLKLELAEIATKGKVRQNHCSSPRSSGSCH